MTTPDVGPSLVYRSDSGRTFHLDMITLESLSASASRRDLRIMVALLEEATRTATAALHGFGLGTP